MSDGYEEEKSEIREGKDLEKQSGDTKRVMVVETC